MTIHQGKESFFIISIYYLTTIIIVVVARVLSPFLLNSNKGTKRVSFFFFVLFSLCIALREAIELQYLRYGDHTYREK